MADEDKPNPPVEPDKDKATNPPDTDKKPDVSPTISDTDKDKETDKSKDYDELRKTYTQTAMEKAQLAKEKAELERRLAEKENPPKAEPAKPTYESRLEKVRNLRERAVAEGIDPTLYDEQIEDLQDKIGQSKNQAYFNRVTVDFNEFIEDPEIKEEIDKGLYSVKELMAIQKAAADKGYDYDLMACRDRFVRDNKKKVVEFQARIKKLADNATSLGGEPKETPKTQTEQDKLRANLGLY